MKNEHGKNQNYPFYHSIEIILCYHTLKGFELAVLRTIPWDKVDIEVLDVETDLAGLLQKGKNLPI